MWVFEVIAASRNSSDASVSWTFGECKNVGDHSCICSFYNALQAYLTTYLTEQKSLLLLFILIILDIFGMPSIWGEQIFRRALHHMGGTAWLDWKTPLVYPIAGLDTTRNVHQDDETEEEKKTEEEFFVPNNVSDSATTSKDYQNVGVLMREHIDIVQHMCADNHVNYKIVGKYLAHHKKCNASFSSTNADNQNSINNSNISSSDAEKAYFEDEMKSLNTASPTLSTITAGQYSKRSTLYFNHFTNAGKAVLTGIANDIRPKLAKIIGVNDSDLHLGKSNFKCVLLRYEGKSANFGWHYDMEEWNCFRCLFLIQKNGNIAPFIYLDDRGSQVEIPLQTLGDGLIFQGTRTYHGVPNTNDPDTLRYMLGFQYYVGEDCSKQNNKSFCSEFRGTDRISFARTLLCATAPYMTMRWIYNLLVATVTNKTIVASQKDFMFPSLLLEWFHVVHSTLCVSVGVQLAVSTFIILSFIYSQSARQIPFVIHGLLFDGRSNDDKKKYGGKIQIIPPFQSQPPPRTIFLILGVIWNVLCVMVWETTTACTYMAYIILSENCLSSSITDRNIDDKQKAIKVLKECYDRHDTSQKKTRTSTNSPVV